MNDSKHNAFLVDQPAPPERIYGWLDSQLSIARYYGGCTYQGASYVIDMQHPDKPLVRQDVLTAELKATKAAEAARRKTEKAAQATAQKGLL
jgi:hypothetical protein